MVLVLIITTTVTSIVAVGMGLFAWRLAREERRRSAARVAALASDLHEIESYRERATVGIRTEPPRGRAEPVRIHGAGPRSLDIDSLELGRPRGTAADAGLFRDVPTGRSRSTLTTVLVVGGMALAMALALVVAAGRGGATAAPTASDSVQPAAPADPAPLELMALSHDFDDGRMTVRGVVRNPTAGATIEQLAAVVFLFERNGGFLDSRRAALRLQVLTPGTESPFIVSFDRAASVGRYRVGFRSGNRVIAHVDRRAATPLARLQ